MIKLKDILLETYAPLVEKKKTKELSDKDKKNAKKKGLVHFGGGAWGKKSQKGKKNAKATHRNIDGKLVKVDSKTGKPKEPSKKEKSEKAEKEKIGKIKVQTGKGEVEVSKILPEPFGDAKDYSHKQADSAKEEVHDYYNEKFTDEEMKKVNKRVGKNGKLKKPLEGDEKKAYDKYKKDQEKYNKDNPDFKEDVKTEEDWLAEQARKRAEKRAAIYDPDTGSEWDDEEDDNWGDDWGEEESDGDLEDAEDYGRDSSGRQLSSKLGGETQKSSLEAKLGIGETEEVDSKNYHIVTNKDNDPVKVVVYKDPKTNKYYAVDDEGNIYENDTDDFREMKEPTTDMRGFEGAMTEKGMKRQNKRDGKGEDDLETTSFEDLLSLLSFGTSDDFDWKDPVGS